MNTEVNTNLVEEDKPYSIVRGAIVFNKSKIDMAKYFSEANPWYSYKMIANPFGMITPRINIDNGDTMGFDFYIGKSGIEKLRKIIKEHKTGGSSDALSIQNINEGEHPLENLKEVKVIMRAPYVNTDNKFYTSCVDVSEMRTRISRVRDGYNKEAVEEGIVSAQVLGVPQPDLQTRLLKSSQPFHIYFRKMLTYYEALAMGLVLNNDSPTGTRMPEVLKIPNLIYSRIPTRDWSLRIGYVNLSSGYGDLKLNDMPASVPRVLERVYMDDSVLR